MDADAIENLKRYRQQRIDDILDIHGGQALAEHLVARGLQAKFAPVVATLVCAACYAIQEPEQYRYVFSLLNEAIRDLEFICDGSEASQIYHEPLSGIIDEHAIVLISGTTMQEMEVFTDGANKRHSTWLAAQAAIKG